MSKKVRVTPELIRKAEKAFKSLEGKGMVVGKGLSRSELRSLERKGLVRRMSIFGKSKFAGYGGTASYVWFLTGD